MASPGRMQAKTVRESALALAAEDGVVLTDLSLRPVAMDSGAAAILADVTCAQPRVDGFLELPVEILSTVRSHHLRDWSRLTVPFGGDGHPYRCHVYRIESRHPALMPLIAFHLQRVTSARDAIFQIATECCLTIREEEVLAGIAIGLTSKELAQRMKISPNTVKAYLRLIMVKMGVTTRSAIVGKLLSYNATKGQNR